MSASLEASVLSNFGRRVMHDAPPKTTTCRVSMSRRLFHDPRSHLVPCAPLPQHELPADTESRRQRCVRVSPLGQQPPSADGSVVDRKHEERARIGVRGPASDDENVVGAFRIDDDRIEPEFGPISSAARVGYGEFGREFARVSYPRAKKVHGPRRAPHDRDHKQYKRRDLHLHRRAPPRLRGSVRHGSSAIARPYSVNDNAAPRSLDLNSLVRDIDGKCRHLALC